MTNVKMKHRTHEFETKDTNTNNLHSSIRYDGYKLGEGVSYIFLEDEKKKIPYPRRQFFKNPYTEKMNTKK